MSRGPGGTIAMRRFTICVLLSFFPGARFVYAQSPPLFPEFPVNTTTAGQQQAGAAGAAGDGKFLVLWAGPDPMFRAFDSNGSGGAEMAAATSGTGPLSLPRIASSGSGTFVAVWQGVEASSRTIFGRLFDAAGPVGDQFAVNTATTTQARKPSVAMNASGEFVVAWSGYSDGSEYGITAQRFDATGAKVGGEFAVNTYTTASQTDPSVAMDGSGNFVVVWSSYGEDKSKMGIFGRRFDHAGAASGGEFQINVFTGEGQYSPRVAADPAGDFVVVWDTCCVDGSAYGVVGRRFDPSGNPTTAEFRVNTYTFADQTFPDVAMDSQGSFTVAWQSERQDDPGSASGWGVFARQFTKSGRPAGSEFAVNTYTTNDQMRPSVALDDRGDLVIAWQSNGQDGSGYGVFARRGGFPPPHALDVDVHTPAGTAANGNGVLEPGERAAVEPSWRNSGTTSLTLSGSASGAGGPPGATYALEDAAAGYGTLAAGATASCYAATANCFQVSVSNPVARPATHWDATFTETLSTGASKVWTLHVGGSFPDVPQTSPFYRKIETMLHSGITSGCDPTHFCPGQAVPRSQMAIFIAKAIVGGPPGLPQQGLVGGKYYDCELAGISLFTDVAPTDSFCRHVHVLAAQNVTLGCTPTQFCPGDLVTRLQMAGFVAKAMVAPAGGSEVPVTYGPDPVTGLSYSCSPGSPNVRFTDVPATDPFCKHVHFLWAKGIVGGCAPTLYCPGGSVTRDQMAKFLVNAFQIPLYGP
jgi:hypothetical protein